MGLSWTNPMIDRLQENIQFEAGGDLRNYHYPKLSPSKANRISWTKHTASYLPSQCSQKAKTGGPTIGPARSSLSHHLIVQLYLVGGFSFNPAENMSSSVGMIILNIWKQKKCSKPPTSYLLDIFHLIWSQARTWTFIYGLIPKPPKFNTRIMCFLSTLRHPKKNIWMHVTMGFSKNGLNMTHCSYGHGYQL